MKTTLTKTIKFLTLIIAFTVLFSACKKDSAIKPVTPDPPAVVVLPAFKATIDGKEYKLDKSKITNTYYSTDGDAVKSNLTTVALGANSDMSFFIGDLKTGQIDLTKKTGTSFNPGTPGVKVFANGAPVFQTYVVFKNDGNAYYAFSGFIKMTLDADGSFTMEWSISFKDATGREFTSAGSITVNGYQTVVKSKSDVNDPTPIAATPTIENIAPTFGRAGDTISVTGTNYSTTAAENGVKVNGVDAVVISATATKLQFKAPATGTTGKVSIKVKNSDVKEGPVFTYVPVATLTAIAPTHAKVGETITLTGTNFSTVLAENVVTIDGKATTIKSATATQLTLDVPQGATTGNVAVKVKGYNVTAAAGLDVKFTVDVPTIPQIVIGVKGMASQITQSNAYEPQLNAVDAEGNLYVVDENDQLVKLSYDGAILKTFTKNDIGFKTSLSYKCTGVASDKDGNIHAILYLSTWPNGQVEVDVVKISTAGVITKEFTTNYYDESTKAMKINSKGEVFVASEMYNTPDILKLKTDGTIEKYLVGGVNGDFGEGRGAYSFDFGVGDDMYVLAYTRTKVNTDLPKIQAIYKFDSQKAKTTVIGSFTDGFQDGTMATAQFKDIRSIAVDNLDIYVSDNGNFRLRKIATRINQVTTIGGNGKQYTSGIPAYNGANLSVNIFNSLGVVYDNRHGVVYSFNKQIQRFVL